MTSKPRAHFASFPRRDGLSRGELTRPREGGRPKTFPPVTLRVPLQPLLESPLHSNWRRPVDFGVRTPRSHCSKAFASQTGVEAPSRHFARVDPRPCVRFPIQSRNQRRYASGKEEKPCPGFWVYSHFHETRSRRKNPSLFYSFSDCSFFRGFSRVNLPSGQVPHTGVGNALGPSQ